MTRVWGRCPSRLGRAHARRVQGSALALLLLGAAPDQQREAVELVDVFDRVCLPFTGDVAGARQAANGMRRLRAPHLMVRPGKAFDASTEAGHMAVLSFDDGMCGAVADDADAGALLGALAERMKQRGVAVSSVGAGPGGAAHAYLLDGGAVHVALMVDMQSVDGRTQVSMLARDGR